MATPQNAPPEKLEFVLFMSPECKFSMNFINKLRTKPELMKKFNVVNIDNLPEIPDEVDEIPCVYDGKQLHQGAPSFKWLNEKMTEFLDAANDGLLYSFLDGNDEQVFGSYSLLEQKNGCHGIGENGSDPTRMAAITDNTNKNRTLDSLVASRSSDLQNLNTK
jgi:hypothetical protein